MCRIAYNLAVREYHRKGKERTMEKEREKEGEMAVERGKEKTVKKERERRKRWSKNRKEIEN